MRELTRVNRLHTLVLGHKYETKVFACSKWTLLQAARLGDIRKLQNCIDENVYLGSKGTDGRTVLHIAAEHRQYKFVEYLLTAKPFRINSGAALDIRGFNALHICVSNGDVEIYRLLQNAGFDTGITTKDGKTVLDLAKEKHHTQLLDLIRRLQNNGTKQIPRSTWPELHHCAVNGSAAECSTLIERFPGDVYVEVNSDTHPYTNLQLPKNRKMTPLELAMHSENRSTLEVLAKCSSFRTIEKCFGDICNIEIKLILVRAVRAELQKKHKDVQHGKLIATGEHVIVIYTNDVKLDNVVSRTAGRKTIYKNINGFDEDNETAIDFELNMKEAGLSQEENMTMKCVVDANSDFLWKNHENLNGIRISAIRTIGGKASRENCIVLCCKFKGFLTEGEENFPRFLSCNGNCFPVDVREEHVVLLNSQPSDILTPLACGGEITGSCADNKVCGTIGPFVELDNQETGFLTCAHVLDNNPAFGVYHGRNDLVYQPKKGSNPDSLVGEVVKMVFKESTNPSIDAAVVRITSPLRIPSSVNFVFTLKAKETAAGIPEGLTFNTGIIGSTQPNSPVLKFGAFTTELRCVCSATGHQERIDYPQGKVLMKGLTKILCRVQHEKGDSGAGVFVKNSDGDLECVGLFFAGRGKEGYFIPIRDVLNHCGNYKLKAFE